MKEAKERGSGAVKRDWEPRLVEARYQGQHARTGAMIGITADGIVSWKTWTSITRSRAVGSDRLAGSAKECRGTFDRRECQRRRSMLRLSQAQPRHSEEREGGRDPEKRAESVRPRDEARRRGVQEESSSSSTGISVRCSREGAISLKNSRWRPSSERVLCCQERCEQIWADTKMPRMC